MNIYIQFAIFSLFSVNEILTYEYFRGGSISASPISHSDYYVTMRFDIEFAWRRNYYNILRRYGRGLRIILGANTYCDDLFLANRNDSKLNVGFGLRIYCEVGCLTPGEMIGTTSGYCTSYSVLDNWSIGQKSIIYNVSVTNNYQIGFTNGNWMTLQEYGYNSSLVGVWEFRLKLDTELRNDTLKVNSSPKCSMIPVFQLIQHTEYYLRISCLDEDNDVLRCRWANFSKQECGGKLFFESF